MMPIGEPEEIAHSIFDAIGTMVMVDMSEDEEEKFRRFYRHSRTGFSVQISTSQWQPWWETVRPDIDKAWLHHRDGLVG